MFRRLKATKDCYITNKIIRNKFRATDANTGEAATLDFFKLYNENSIDGEDESIELTRTLIKFDLNPLRSLTGSILDYTSNTFKCTVNLYDVYGGQTLPSNFNLILFPLSQSFDEGVGRDVITFQDIDSANFITASTLGETATAWFHTGANKQGLLGSDDIDIISSGNLGDGRGVKIIAVSQSFSNGTENLSMDVTKIVSATLAGQIPDYGFRLSFSGTQETDAKTRFVKRFSSRHNSNTRKHPRLEVKFNDAVQDHHEAFFFNLTGSIFINNFARGEPSYLVSGSRLIQVSGSDCLLVKLQSGSFEKTVSGSSLSFGTSFVTGVYSATFAIDSFNTSVVSGTTTISDFVRDSGSMNFDVFWKSIDHSVGYHTGNLKIKKQETTGFKNSPQRFEVNITNMKPIYGPDEAVRLRCVAYDADEKVKASKLPLYRVSEIVTQAHYRIRDAYSDEIIIPFDTVDNSTLMSTDSEGMYFDIYTNDFSMGRVYAIDVLFNRTNRDQIFLDAGGTFRIDP